MVLQNRAEIRKAVKEVIGEARAMHENLVRIPANAQTGEGYENTVDYISDALAGAAHQVEALTVPEAHLRACWGENLEHARDYLTVDGLAPRRVVTARLNGTSNAVGVHLTNNYDLYWGPAKERAGTVAQIAALRALRLSGVALKQSVFLSATPDAYIGGESGAGYISAAGLGRSDRVLSASLGGNNLITVGYKGMIWAKIAIKGKPAHGSRPHEGRNAIEAMMWVQSRVLELNRAFVTRPLTIPIRPVEASAASLTMCRIEGNLHSSFIAPDCALYLDRRLNPGETVADGVAELETLVADARRQTGFEISLSIPHRVEPSYTDPDSALYRSFAGHLAEASGKVPEPVVWSHYLGLHYFTSGWGSQAIAYSPGAIGHGKVEVEPEDDVLDLRTLEPAIEAIAMTAYDQANREKGDDND